MTMLTLVLANGRGFPAGSADHRYEVEVALDAAGHIDLEAWRAAPAPWPVRRFRPGEPQRTGELRWDGETGGWSLHFPPPGGEEGPGASAEVTEPMLHAGVLRPGEHVTVQDETGADYSYRIVSME
jgi:hypothetical protein